jgi:hypothetical protein
VTEDQLSDLVMASWGFSPQTGEAPPTGENAAPARGRVQHSRASRGHVDSRTCRSSPSARGRRAAPP